MRNYDKEAWPQGQEARTGQTCRKNVPGRYVLGQANDGLVRVPAVGHEDQARLLLRMPGTRYTTRTAALLGCLLLGVVSCLVGCNQSRGSLHVTVEVYPRSAENVAARVEYRLDSLPR